MAPLHFLAECARASGWAVSMVIGAQTAGDVIFTRRFEALGAQVTITTEEGSQGERGLATDAAEQRLDQAASVAIYACGPEPMLKAVDQIGIRLKVPGQLSLEAPMPCGYGVCLGCVVPLTSGGHARVCADGPVFDIGEVKL